MGSSTASETTINTSTDSSNTIVTTMTATDGDNTEDSMDMMEPVDYLNSDIFEAGNTSNAILQPVPLSPKTPPTAKQQTPPTAKLDETKFNFEIQNSPRQAGKSEIFTFDGGQNKDNLSTTERPRTVDRLMEEHVEGLKLDTRRRNSYKAAQQDFDKIEVVEDETTLKHGVDRRSYRKQLDGKSSPNLSR